jgi:hypothetical protein|tara:strand:- start:2417 stop:2683 length:267 start_codon:yes stop_codon:yes gene_type:complete
MKHIDEEEQKQIKINSIRESIPTLVAQITMVSTTDYSDVITDEERAVLNLLNLSIDALGSDYDDETALNWWNGTLKTLETLPRWGSYW